MRGVYRPSLIEYPKPPTGNNASGPESKKLAIVIFSTSIFSSFHGKTWHFGVFVNIRLTSTRGEPQ